MRTVFCFKYHVINLYLQYSNFSYITYSGKLSAVKNFAFLSIDHLSHIHWLVKLTLMSFRFSSWA
jgi:hypothetical protein